MATKIITSTTSVLTTGADLDAFSFDSASADTLIVEAGGFLITLGPSSDAAALCASEVAP